MSQTKSEMSQTKSKFIVEQRIVEHPNVPPPPTPVSPCTKVIQLNVFCCCNIKKIVFITKKRRELFPILRFSFGYILSGFNTGNYFK